MSMVTTATSRTVQIFRWNKSFDTGFREVDAEQQVLIQLINQLAGYVICTDKAPPLSHVINELIAYSYYHFRVEEAIWHDYVPHDESEIRHKAEHEDFMRGVRRIRDAQIKAEKSVSEVVHDAFAFLIDWLTSHILVSDRRMGFVIQAMQKGMSLEDAKRHAAEEMQEPQPILLDAIPFLNTKFASNAIRLSRPSQEGRQDDSWLGVWRNAFEHSWMGAAILDVTGNALVAVNPTFAAERGYRQEELSNKPIMKLLPIQAVEDIKDRLAKLDMYSHGVIECEQVTKDGRRYSVTLDVSWLEKEAGRPAGQFALVLDITGIKASERQARRDKVMQTVLREMVEISHGSEPLKILLARCLDRIFDVTWHSPFTKGSIFLMKEGGNVLEMVASHQMESQKASPSTQHFPGSEDHGLALREREIQYSDVSDEKGGGIPRNTSDYGSQSMPLVFENKVLGVLRLYWAEGYQSDPRLEHFIRAVSRILAGLVNRKYTEKDRHLAAMAFESQEGMMVTDTSTQILSVNKAFTALTGYAPEEVIGKLPSVLKSDRQGQEFYREMWQKLSLEGSWQGELWNSRKNGEIYPVWLSISAVKDDMGTVTHYVGVYNDITPHTNKENEILQLAYYDVLTGLPNRRLFVDRLQQAQISHQRSRIYGALIYLDLDHFKLLNDALGHDYGDKLLIEVARRLQASVRQGDTVSRFGGDEFVVLLKDLSISSGEAAILAEAIAEKILNALNAVYWLADKEYYNSTSIGVSLFLGSSEPFEELLKRADMAMYQAKSDGRNVIRFFDPAMQAEVMQRAALEAEMRVGLTRGEFILHYQPKVNARGEVVAFEALARWHHPEHGLMHPSEFIMLAEKCGLSFALGQRLLRQACEKLKSWSEHPVFRGYSLSVNISPKQFLHKDFVGMVLDTVESTGANPERLMLEITEGLLLDNIETCLDKMRAISEKGIRFSIDDFGTGYFSLASLKRLPMDELKIDRTFVSDLAQDDNAADICRAIINMAHSSLGLNVVAEGVESESQRHFLSEVHKCDLMQGYLFGAPLSDEDLEHFLSAN